MLSIITYLFLQVVILAIAVAAYAEPEAEADAQLLGPQAQQPLPALAGLGQVQVHSQSPHASGFYYHVQTYDTPREQPIAAPVAYHQQPQQYYYMPAAAQNYNLNPYLYHNQYNNQYNPYIFNGGYNGFNGLNGGYNLGLNRFAGHPYHLNQFPQAQAYFAGNPAFYNPQALAHPEQLAAHPEQLARPELQQQLLQ